MFPANQNKLPPTEMTVYGTSQSGEMIAVQRKIPGNLHSVQQLKEVFATSDLLTEEERRTCNTN